LQGGGCAGRREQRRGRDGEDEGAAHDRQRN
jgi:hypothetical protein